MKLNSWLPCVSTSKAWLSYTGHKLQLKFQSPSSLLSHEGFIHWCRVLGHCRQGLQWTDVWHCSSSAGTGHRSITDPSQIHHRPTSLSCHHPHALPEQGKGKQAAQCGLQSPGINTLPGRHSQHEAHTISWHRCGTQATPFWVCSEENTQGQIYLFSFFTALDVLTSTDQQQEPEMVQRCLSIPACIRWSASQISSSKTSSLLQTHFLIFKHLYLCNNSYNLKSFSKTALNWNKYLVTQKLHVWTYSLETWKRARFRVQRWPNRKQR